MTAWRLDDWMRPVRGRRYGGSRRAVTPRDRRWMAGALGTAALVVGGLFVAVEPGRAFAMSGGMTGVALVQAVNLYRSRDVGWH